MGPTPGPSRRRLLATALGAGVLAAGVRPLPAGSADGTASGLRRAAIGITGRVTDALTDRPIVGAVVSVGPMGVDPVCVLATTDDRGSYVIDLPPGTYSVHVAAQGYIAASADGLRVGNGLLRGPFGLLPERPEEADLERTYTRVVRQTQVSPPQYTFQTTMHSGDTATLPSTIVVRWPDGRQEEVDREEYVKGVVPNEMPASWPTEALRAQAVVARTYGVIYYLTYGYVCTDTRCQVYTPPTSPRPATTNAAVEATRGIVATYGGSIIWAFFFAQCNAEATRNSENALVRVDSWKPCHEDGWKAIPYCRARPCGGHSRYTSTCGYRGHGVGMCQWGARAGALSDGNYAGIIQSYYTGVSLGPPSAPRTTSPASGTLVLFGAPVRLGWSATAPEYQAELYAPSGQVLQPPPDGWTTSPYWDVTAAERGQYRWRVRAQARNAIVESPWSPYSTFLSVDTINRAFAPVIRSKSGG